MKINAQRPFLDTLNMPYVTTAERIGIEKGLKEGKTAGKKEQGLATAKYLISLGILSEEQISAASDLSLEEIQEVKKNLERGEEPVDRKDC
jgi:predicted transposase YdaD